MKRSLSLVLLLSAFLAQAQVPFVPIADSVNTKPQGSTGYSLFFQRGTTRLIAKPKTGVQIEIPSLKLVTDSLAKKVNAVPGGRLMTTSEATTLTALVGNGAAALNYVEPQKSLPTTVETELRKLTEKGLNVGHLGQLMSKMKVQPVRIALTGTSISSFETAGVQTIAAWLQTKFGRAGTVLNLGGYGGTYLPSNGYVKQRYGGSSFVRMVMQPGNNPLTLSGYGDKIILVYSKESDGSEFGVSVDGGAIQNLSSAGSQSYNNEAVFDFSSTTKEGYHTITITAPSVTNGRAYLERIEFISNTPGVIIENATLGGSALREFMSPSTTVDAGNLPLIPVVGNTGTDSFFGRTGATKPDAIIMEHFTNDGDVALFQSVLDRAMQKTKEGATPIVLISEMPAMSFLDASGVLNTQKKTMLNSLRQAALNPHVSFIDWAAMVDHSNRTLYEQTYFPGTDKTHPNANGERLLLNALVRLFGVEHPGVNSVNRIALERYANARSGGSVAISNKQIGSLLRGLDKAGRIEDRVVVGQAVDLLSNKLLPVALSLSVRNQITGGNTNETIRASSSKSAFGPYITNLNSQLYITKKLAGKTTETTATVTILFRRTGGSSSVTMSSGGDNLAPRFVSGSTATQGAGGGTQISLPVATDEAPLYWTFTVKAHASAEVGRTFSLVLNGNVEVYGAWVAEGEAATITQTEFVKTRELGLPLSITGDLAATDVIQGQSYRETIDSVTVDRTATAGVVHKVINAGAWGGLYRLNNRSTVKYYELSPSAIGTTAFNDFMGGNASDASGSPFYLESSTLTGYLYGKTYTLTLRVQGGTPYMRVYLQNGGQKIYLLPVGTWSTTGADLVQGLTNENLAFTFTLPAQGAFTLNNPTLRVEIAFAGKITNATLVQGSSACFANLN
ncbi:SGNH/GDSL hydrolase family protein [Tellurirhabdus bombi]|uniref:hypothetical protein n=1 Tax=Tellurirhabdus bombi TaxID=2907205 RepID=UPI001F3BBAE8|nr:hypothetical protein [Tellurirhabdus bombi]